MSRHTRQVSIRRMMAPALEFASIGDYLKRVMFTLHRHSNLRAGRLQAGL